jgi:U4/U6 small nuclear ribonucleoprotein PRP3
MDRRQGSPALGPRHDTPSRVQKPESTADKMAALKARVAAAIGSSKAKGGLNVGLHPALEDLGQWKPSGRNSDANPLSSNSQRDDRNHQSNQGSNIRALGNQPSDPQSNPYFDETSTNAPSSGKQRQSRQLIFNQKGKYIQQANALRRQAALEAMKKRIAAQTRKAGIDEDLDLEKNLLVQAPPEVEWWDESLVEGSYESIEDESTLKIGTPDSIVTEYIQHPVALQPPQDKNIPAPKPMYLTSKEQAKLRRQRRMAENKEEQAKIRLGLIPAPPPKIKKSNLMRVATEQAVRDPTALEAKVNREIQERHQKHLQTNEDRKLTKEEKHEKLALNQQKDAAKGIHLMVFKIDSLANGQHRFKVQKNAEQLALTGTCIMHPKFNLVVVEGGEHSIKKYRKLMLNRIDWTENAPSRERDGGQQPREWLVAEDEKGDLKDTSLNECKLVFEGEEKGRAFRIWKSRVCETDAEAREILARHKMDNFWSLAKAM